MGAEALRLYGQGPVTVETDEERLSLNEVCMALFDGEILSNTPRREWNEEPHIVVGRFSVAMREEEIGGLNARVRTVQHVIIYKNDQGELALVPHRPDGFGGRITIDSVPEIEADQLFNLFDKAEFMRSGEEQQHRKRYTTRVVNAKTEPAPLYMLSVKDRVIALGGNPNLPIPKKSESDKWAARGAIPGRLKPGDNGQLVFVPDEPTPEEEDQGVVETPGAPIEMW